MPRRTCDLNRLSLDALPPAAPGRRDYYHLKSARRNEQVPAGFVLQVTPTGAKTYFLVRRIGGAQRRVFIARCEDLDPAAALERAWEITSEVVRGQDPTLARKAQRQEAAAAELTLAAYWKSYRARHVTRLRPRTIQLYDTLAAKYLLPRLGQTPLAAITRSMVAELHDQVTAEVAGRKRTGDGSRSANTVVVLLRAVLNDAIDRAVLVGVNPASRIRLAKEIKRERYLSIEEISRLYAALEDDARERGDRSWSDFFRLALTTGARRANLCAMAWKDLDLNERVWTIPQAETKTGMTYLVALEPGAVEILTRRRQEAEALAKVRWLAAGDPEAPLVIDKFVFPGRGSTGHLAEIKGAWSRVCKRAELVGVRVHDLRHTHASLLAASGVSLPMIGAQLGHRSVQTTARYSHLARRPVQLAVEAAFKALGTGGDGE